MVTLSSTCRAKDPATCDYHGYEVRASAYVAMGQYDEALAELATRDRTGIKPEEVDEFIRTSAQLLDRLGTHTSHCCNIHGCKYGDSDCPVQTGSHAQEYACEMCDWNRDTYEERYGKPKTHFKTISALDPAGCACADCATGQHVPEDVWRLNARAGDMQRVQYQQVANNTGHTLTAVLEEPEFSYKSATRMQLILKGEDKDPHDDWDDFGR